MYCVNYKSDSLGLYSTLLKFLTTDCRALEIQLRRTLVLPVTSSMQE